MNLDYIMKFDYIIIGILIITILVSIYLIWTQKREHFATRKHHHHKVKTEVKTEVKSEVKVALKQEIKSEVKGALKQEIKPEAKTEINQVPKLPQEFLQPLPPILSEAEMQQLYNNASPETFPELQQEFAPEIKPEINQEKSNKNRQTNFDDSISVYEDDNIVILRKDRLKGAGNILNPNNEDIVTYDPYKCMKGDMEPFASIKKPRNISSVCGNKSLVKRFNVEGVNNLNHMLTQAEIQKLKFNLDDPGAYYRDHFKFLRPELDFYYKGSNMPDYTSYANINEIGRIPLEKSKDSKYPLPANFTFKNSPSFE